MEREIFHQRPLLGTATGAEGFEIPTRTILHRVVKHPVDLAKVVDARDVSVVQGSRGLGFLLEALFGNIVADQVVVDNLERGDSFETNMLRLVSGAVAAFSQFPK